MDKSKEKGGFVGVLNFEQMCRTNYIVVIYCKYWIAILPLVKKFPLLLKDQNCLMVLILYFEDF